MPWAVMGGLGSNLVPATPTEPRLVALGGGGGGRCITANWHFNSQTQIKPKVVIKGEMKTRVKVTPHSRKRSDKRKRIEQS